MTRKLIVGAGIIGCLTIAIVGIVLFRSTLPHATASPSLVDKSFLSLLPQKQTDLIDTTHLAPGIVSPTNKWFSGLALQAEPQPAFPLPLSFKPTGRTFEISLPRIKTTPTTIFGVHTAALQASITNASSYQITRYDELSVDLTYKDKQNEAIGVVTISAGSPYIFYEAIKTSTLSISSQGTNSTVHNNATSYSLHEDTYRIAGFDGATLTRQTNTTAVSALKGSIVSFYVLPAGVQNDPLLSTAGNKVIGTSVAYTQHDSDMETTLTYKTKKQQPTAYGFLPHQSHTTQDSLFGYQSLYGKIDTHRGTTFAFKTPTIPVSDSLDLSRIDANDKSLLVTTLRQDINATQFGAIDTYFGGKNVYRAAQLLKLAETLKEESLAASIREKLNRELSTWLSAGNGDKSFYYDQTIHGIVGKTASFGADAFNDHHFHYGYFIYAAAILSQYDTDFLTANKAAIDLLVADIANYKMDEDLPLRRAFDPYFGHAWASGTSPFGDGNNQESSSEALNAWIGTRLWGDVTKNEFLSRQATWMLSNEAASAGAYWTNFDQQTAPYNQGYGKSIVSLNWGGKRDYATFFSADPNAIVGIQLLPMSPTMTYLSREGGRIADTVSEATATSSSQFADYILMYEQLQNGNITLVRAQEISGAGIDSANSRAYLYAWILSHQK